MAGPSRSLRAIALLLFTTLLTLVFARVEPREGEDGYIGYKLEHRGDPEAVTYETENTPEPGEGAGGVQLAEEPDVYLNANVSVGLIYIEVDNITAKVNLDADVLKLLHFSAGVDVSIDRVKLSIENVSAKVELEARLGNVVKMVDDVLSSIDLNPIIATLGQDVTKIINSTTGILDQPLAGADNSGANINAKRDVDHSYNIERNVLYSVNDYTGKTHTNRVLAQNGSIVDEFLDNDGTEHGRAIVGYYSRDMTFNGHNKTISVDGQPKEYELQYVYTPFPGIEVISWVYLDMAGRVTRTQVLAEAMGGGSSTISNDSEL
ncbi:hypothetical protein B0T17DRAFT_486654 [Bombardia bombarda]|uniref:Uncharacterized protein n=1 Tax=Bombardia bombarda TaxID=252184 RepID=A0AA39XBT8_9PEZI|nr:hypothetical protein B0T17DRAFT_486654 [Bombardia bombarda]